MVVITVDDFNDPVQSYGFVILNAAIWARGLFFSQTTVDMISSVFPAPHV